MTWAHNTDEIIIKDDDVFMVVCKFIMRKFPDEKFVELKKDEFKIITNKSEYWYEIDFGIDLEVLCVYQKINNEYFHLRYTLKRVDHDNVDSLSYGLNLYKNWETKCFNKPYIPFSYVSVDKEEKEMNEVWVCHDPGWFGDKPLVVPNSRDFVKDIIAALVKRLFPYEDFVSGDSTYVETDKAKYSLKGVIYSDALGSSKTVATIVRSKKAFAQTDCFDFVLKREMSTKDQTEKFFVDVHNNFNLDRQRMNDIWRNNSYNKMWQYRPHPKFVQFNGDYTTVVWKDGSHTVVKLAEGEEYDEEKAILYAIVKHMCGDVGCNLTRYLEEFYSHQKDVTSYPWSKDESEIGKALKNVFENAEKVFKK